MNRGKAMAVLAAVCAVSAGMTATAYGAESTFEMKKKVVSLLGILTTSDRNAEVTREEFAGMLVKASSQRQSYGAAVTGAVFATWLRTASTPPPSGRPPNEWMSGFLGGNFKPEEGVTLRDAAKGVLGLLGYTNEDFSGNLNGNRMAEFSALSLTPGSSGTRMRS